MSHSSRTIPLRTRLSHLALWPACYTLGIYLLAVLTLDLPAPDWQTVLYLLLVGHACYLLDRVKLSDDRQDPADAIALPNRALLFAERAGAIRIVLLIELLMAMVSGFLISPLLALIPLGALLGVQLYAGRAACPGKPRFKDLPALKSFFISSAHIALVVAVLWGNDHNLIEHPRGVVLLTIAGLWLIVSGDAVLCDLDDHDSDAMYGTRSLPVLLGNKGAWLVAQAMLALGGLMLMAHSKPDRLLMFCAAAIWISGYPTLFIKNRRDLIDARLLPIALIALLLR
ncbi:MAG: UbiA family prenyltransferase [Phycisphaerales bacterium JB052]